MNTTGGLEQGKNRKEKGKSEIKTDIKKEKE